jgi:hypothetical protein
MTNGKLNLDDFPTLESMLQKINSINPRTKSFELLVPSRMTFHGRLICRTFPEAVVLNRLLQMGFSPVRGEWQSDGKLFEFTNETSPVPSTPRTEPPLVDIAARIPAFAPLAKTTTRLHPQRAVVSDLAASKLGGTFLWPRSEPWPRCNDSRHHTGVGGRKSATQGVFPSLVGLIQLNARDFPQIPFREGTDLFQLLWCPSTEDVHDDRYLFPKLFAYWRNSKTVSDPLPENPLTDFMETIHNHFPVSCQFFPETVQEFPRLSTLYRLTNWHEIEIGLEGMSNEIRETSTDNMDVLNQYDNALSACPSTKVGGHPYWVQDDETPWCECGRKMEFLLQLCDWEYVNIDDIKRWIPLTDRWAVNEWNSNAAAAAILQPPNFDFGHSVYYIFICSHCPERPIRLVTQY